jgi:hypothetical protein
MVIYGLQVQIIGEADHFRLEMQDDGNLVIYDRDGLATWATGTNGKNKRRLKKFL